MLQSTGRCRAVPRRCNVSAHNVASYPYNGASWRDDASGLGTVKPFAMRCRKSWRMLYRLLQLCYIYPNSDAGWRSDATSPLRLRHILWKCCISSNQACRVWRFCGKAEAAVAICDVAATLPRGRPALSVSEDRNLAEYVAHPRSAARGRLGSVRGSPRCCKSAGGVAESREAARRRSSRFPGRT